MKCNKNGKVILNGYISIYKPEHKRSFDNGCVYEHILVAEKMLNRELLKGECVHHKDRNRKNNDENNLMVFATVSDHTAYHNGAKAIKLDNGSYICEKEKNSICPICNKNEKEYSAKMCMECYRKQQSKNIPLKETLKDLILIYPFTKIGEMYNVSDNAVRKWCKKYNLPFKKSEIKKLKNNIQ